MEEERIVVARHGKGFLEKQGGATILHVKGSPYERGYQHGYLLGDMIDATLPKALASAATVDGLASGGGIEDGYKRLKDGMEHARGFIPPEFMEEMRGLADALAALGSPIDFNDILIWNMMYDSRCYYARSNAGDPGANFYRQLYPDPIGCSSFSAWGQATQNGNMLFGKNMDNLDLPGTAEGRVIIFCDPEHGLGHVNVAQAGMLAVDGGLNEAGVFMMTHNSPSVYQTMRGCGIGVLSRLILQNCYSVEDAINILTVYPRCVGINYHVADAKLNRAVVIETNAKETAVRYPYRQDVLWSTNHYNCYPGWMGYEGRNMVEGQKSACDLKDISSVEAWQKSLGEKENSLISAAGRFKQYGKLLSESYGKLNIEKGIEILRDRHHPDTGEERDWDTPARSKNDGVTISWLLPRKTYAEKVRYYKSEEEGPVAGQITCLWSMIAEPASGDVNIAAEGLPAHRFGFRHFNLLRELGR